MSIGKIFSRLFFKPAPVSGKLVMDFMSKTGAAEMTLSSLYRQAGQAVPNLTRTTIFSGMMKNSGCTNLADLCKFV